MSVDPGLEIILVQGILSDDRGGFRIIRPTVRRPGTGVLEFLFRLADPVLVHQQAPVTLVVPDIDGVDIRVQLLPIPLELVPELVKLGLELDLRDVRHSSIGLEIGEV